MVFGVRHMPTVTHPHLKAVFSHISLASVRHTFAPTDTMPDIVKKSGQSCESIRRILRINLAYGRYSRLLTHEVRANYLAFVPHAMLSNVSYSAICVPRSRCRHSCESPTSRSSHILEL